MVCFSGSVCLYFFYLFACFRFFVWFCFCILSLSLFPLSLFVSWLATWLINFYQKVFCLSVCLSAYLVCLLLSESLLVEQDALSQQIGTRRRQNLNE